MVTRIPLVRPSLPDPRTFIPIWQEETERTGQYSNFGGLWEAAAYQLSELTGRRAIPVSSGTEAITLATYASMVHHDFWDVTVEAFTFEAGRIAAERLGGVAEHIATTDTRTNKTVVVRTVPFGMHRAFTGRQFDGEATVVDAAGAFGPSMLANVRYNQPVAVSFHATKNFPIGEGGAVLLPKDWGVEADLIKRASNFGFNHARERYGSYATNAKLDELRCAMLLAQLERVEHFKARSQRIRRHTLRLIERCSDVPGITAPYQLGAWQSLVVIGCNDAATLSARLADRGIASRRVFQPSPREDLLTPDQRNLLALPSDATDDELEHVAAAIEEVERG
jgi:dTDP-4-amino-4,6-dideoxygalactose transaminase